MTERLLGSFPAASILSFLFISLTTNRIYAHVIVPCNLSFLILRKQQRNPYTLTVLTQLLTNLKLIACPCVFSLLPPALIKTASNIRHGSMISLGLCANLYNAVTLLDNQRYVTAKI